jgi:hypothetical protein
MKNTDQRPPSSEYAPYEAFWEGFVDYQHGLHRNPYDAVLRIVARSGFLPLFLLRLIWLKSLC